MDKYNHEKHQQFVIGLIHAIGEGYEYGCRECVSIFKIKVKVCPFCTNPEILHLSDLLREIL